MKVSEKSAKTTDPAHEVNPRKKLKKIILRGLALFALINLILALPIASLVETYVLKGKGNRKVSQEAYVREWLSSEMGMDSYAIEEKYRMEKISIKSSGTEGYTIQAFHYYPEGESIGFIVMAHGMNSSHLGIYPEMEIFLEEGLEVYSFDERKFGESTYPFISYGYYEGMDVKDVFEYAVAMSLGDARVLGVWGQSMGGAAVENALDEMSLINMCNCVILDCPMGAMDELTGAPKIQNSLAGVINVFVSGYSFKDQNPYPQIANVAAPVLLVRAGKETVIPKVSLDTIEETLKAAPGELTVYVSPEAEHACIAEVDREGYKNAVHEFLERYR